jgi:acyl-CoA dehydrogenase
MHDLGRTERQVIACRRVARWKAAIDGNLKYVREAQDLGQPVWHYQNTRFKLGELASYRAQSPAVISDRCVLGSSSAGKAGHRKPPSMAKLWCSDMQQQVLDECVQLHGGYGYMNEYLVCRLFADSRVQRIYGGTNEIMKEVIARGL